MATFRFKRQQLEDLFGPDYDGIINFELMINSIQSISDDGLDSSELLLDTTNFNGLFDATTTTVQRMADVVDDINTSEVPELTNLYYTDERVDDRVATFIQNGTGISWVYDDAGGTLTPTVSLDPFTTDDLDRRYCKLLLYGHQGR
jgi:nitric oxide synthase oxygenase domain/subunit